METNVASLKNSPKSWGSSVQFKWYYRKDATSVIKRIFLYIYNPKNYLVEYVRKINLILKTVTKSLLPSTYISWTLYF